MIKKMEPVLKIESHPFYLGPVPPDTEWDFPLNFPFYLGVDPDYAIPVLILTDKITNALSKAYSLGSMLSTPLGKSSLANERMYEVLNKILELYNGNVKDVKFLEIGCGNGSLLNELKIRGADVTGLEIGPQGQEGAEKFGFKVISKSIEKADIREKFDCLFSYACVEHLIDLGSFFSACRNCMKENGLFFHVVPNSEFQFKLGYVDHLAHEHINYFTAKNGVRLFQSQGFDSVRSSLSRAENELFLWGYYDSNKTITMPGRNREFINKETEKLKEYAYKIKTETDRIAKKIKTLQTIGFYAGGYEYSMYLKDIKKVRYFDGDPFKHGKSWLRGLPVIESPMNLKTYPVDHLIICKNHYFDKIVKYLIDEIGISRNIKIHKLNDQDIF